EGVGMVYGVAFRAPFEVGAKVVAVVKLYQQLGAVVVLGHTCETVVAIHLVSVKTEVAPVVELLKNDVIAVALQELPAESKFQSGMDGLVGIDGAERRTEFVI